MAVTPSTMLKLGTRAPDFDLPDTDGNQVSLSSFSGSDGLFVMFICNHCPYVKHIADGLKLFADDYVPKGLATIAISSNDVTTHPHDSPLKMKEEKQARGYNFPYLYDEDQSAAKAYHAACTPDFFLFNKDRELVYRGQFDASRPGNDESVTGAEMRAAADTMLAGKPIDKDQSPSMGCNIKWQAGNEPDYFNN